MSHLGSKGVRDGCGGLSGTCVIGHIGGHIINRNTRKLVKPSRHVAQRAPRDKTTTHTRSQVVRGGLHPGVGGEPHLLELPHMTPLLLLSPPRAVGRMRSRRARTHVCGWMSIGPHRGGLVCDGPGKGLGVGSNRSAPRAVRLPLMMVRWSSMLGGHKDHARAGRRRSY